MDFVRRIEDAIGYRTGMYDMDGNLLDGKDTGFIKTYGVSFNNGCTGFKCGENVIVVDSILTRDAVNLIIAMYSYIYKKEAADLLQPLEYILRNNVNEESIVGRYSGYTAFYIRTKSDIIEFLMNIYDSCSVQFVKDDGGIYMVKVSDDSESEADSIIDGAREEKGINLIIGCGREVSSNYTIKSSASHAKNSALLAESLGRSYGFFHIDMMILYGLIYSEDIDKINYYMNGGYSGFRELVNNKELIDTAEVLFSCHLNISEASRKLYLHRNTLLYRIEKIKSLTGLDIKKFEEAVIFRTVVSIFRLKRI